MAIHWRAVKNSLRSTCWHFRPSFVNCCPSNLLCGSNPPPFRVQISIQYTRIQCTVRTVAADLRRGEHIQKMQNNIGRKSSLRVLRQLRSKDGGGGWVPYRAVPCRPRPVALGLALRSPQLPWIYARSNSANSAAAAPKTPRWARTDFHQISNLPLYQLRHTFLMNNDNFM